MTWIRLQIIQLSQLSFFMKLTSLGASTSAISLAHHEVLLALGGLALVLSTGIAGQEQ